MRLGDAYGHDLATASVATSLARSLAVGAAGVVAFAVVDARNALGFAVNFAFVRVYRLCPARTVRTADGLHREPNAPLWRCAVVPAGVRLIDSGAKK